MCGLPESSSVDIGLCDFIAIVLLGETYLVIIDFGFNSLQIHNLKKSHLNVLRYKFDLDVK